MPKENVIDAHDIAQALGIKSKSGQGYLVKCPVREHRNGFMKISDGSDRVLVHCYAGCEFKEIVKELSSQGLWPESTPEQKAIYQEKKRQEEIESARIYIAVYETRTNHSETERKKYYYFKRLLRNGT